jgi:hypothetical protein
MKKNKKIYIAVAIVAIVAVAMFSLYKFFAKPTSTGSKTVTLEVVDDQGNSKKYTEKTDAEFLNEFMDQLVEEKTFSYESSTSDYGLFINSVNGVTADYTKDKAYWAIYVNGEYGTYSADKQPVTDQDEFKLAYEKQ